MKVREITPRHLQCGVGPCPALFETDRGTYVIVGTRLSSKQTDDLMPGKVAPHEEAVEISKEFFAELNKK